eukprot:398452_1
MSEQTTVTNLSILVKNNWGYDWLKLLKINDKIDVYDEIHNAREYEDTWMIGTIIDMKTNDNIYQFNISYDGYSDHELFMLGDIQNWVTINYNSKQITQNIKLAKLNTFTPIHSYLNDKTLSKHVCAWYYNSKYGKCTICNRNICLECMALKGRMVLICKTCTQLTEFKHIYSILYENVSTIKYMETHIIKILAEYSVGYIVNCCNSEQCTNDVYFESSFEVQHSLRFPWKYEQRLWQYCPKRDMNNTLFLCDNYRRIFCGKCYLNKLKACKYPECNRNKEVQLFGHKTICKNHEKCYKCDFGLDSTKTICNVCDNLFHRNCGKFDRFDVCNKCKMDNKMELMWNILKTFIGCDEKWIQNEIVSVIEGYIVDYIVNCCCCNDVIVIKHRIQFEQNHDDRNNKISSYVLKYGGNISNGVYLYGKIRRIFCWSCTKDKLTVCQAKNCYNKDVKYGNKGYFLCRKHPICSMCNDVNYYNIHKCNKCGCWLKYNKMNDI